MVFLLAVVAKSWSCKPVSWNQFKPEGFEGSLSIGPRFMKVPWSARADSPRERLYCPRKSAGRLRGEAAKLGNDVTLALALGGGSQPLFYK